MLRRYGSYMAKAFKIGFEPTLASAEPPDEKRIMT